MARRFNQDWRPSRAENVRAQLCRLNASIFDPND